MIAEIIPEAYDAMGIQVSKPFSHRKGPHPTFPMGRYISQPLSVRCKTMADVRNFLAGCIYISDQELFGKRDYWQPPEDFEKKKKGDCEDFALWTWRQLLNMGYDARFVAGRSGRYGDGHAWVQYFQDGKCFLLEPLGRKAGFTLPRLWTLRYEPRISVSWDGKTLRYFSHKKPTSPVPWPVLVSFVPEYFVFWVWAGIMMMLHLPQIAGRFLRRNIFRRGLWLQRKRSER